MCTVPAVNTLSPAIRGTLSAYQSALVARFGARLRLLRVFGSHARAEARADSDVDVAVVIEGLTADERREAIDLCTDADPTGELLLSPWVVSTQHFELLQRRGRAIAADVLAEGVSL